MPAYTFTTSTGEKFTVNAPNGVSETDARKVFDQQINAGALKNVGVGQTVEGLGAGEKLALAAVASLTSQPVTKPITAAQALKQTPATSSVGSLSPRQVTGMISQAAVFAGQSSSTISNTGGVGKFGLTPQQLEQQGYLKPGTTAAFLKNNPGANMTQVLQSPMVWTGKDAINNVDSFLGNQNVQNLTQANLMNQGLTGLKSLGVATGKESPQQLSALVQGAAVFGAATMAAWTKGLAPAAVTGAIGALAKGAQQAVNLVTNGLPNINTATAGATDTVKRAGVDSAIRDSINDPKVPAITYGEIEREPEQPDPNQPAVEKFKTAIEKLTQRANYYQQQAQELSDQLISLEAGVITRGEWTLVNDKLQSIRTQFNGERQSLQSELDSAYEALPGSIKPDYLPQYNSVLRLFKIVVDFIVYLKKRIADDEALIGI